MPKEIVHMGIARMVGQDIQADSMFHGPVMQHADLFLYGAVAPDTGSYYLKGPGSEKIQAAGRKFHVDNASALMPVIDLLNRHHFRDGQALAFAAGVFCHIMTDTVFHPMIYYYSGLDNVHEGATVRHRLFETILDEFAYNFLKGFSPHRPRNVFLKMEYRLVMVSKLLKVLFRQTRKNHAHWMLPAFWAHHLSICLFHEAWFPALLKTLGTKVSPQIKVLFYSQQNRTRQQFFNSPISYQDPETGRMFSHNLEEMIVRVRKDTLTLLAWIETCLKHDKQITENQIKRNIPVLIRPCPPLNRAAFRYWNEVPDMESIICS